MKRRRYVFTIGLVLLFTFYVTVNGYSAVTVPTDVLLSTSSYQSANGTAEAPQISSDGIGHVYVTWYDYRNGNTDIYFNYSSDYGATWQANDIRLDTGDIAGANSSKFPQISNNSNGYIYVTWADFRDGSTDIYFNFSSDYGITWQSSDIRLDTGDTAGASRSSEPQINSDGNGHVYVTWHDYRNGKTDIYFNYSNDYGATWQTNDTRLDTGDAAGASRSEDPQISNDDSGRVYVIWADVRNGDEDIYFNYSSNYGATWQTNDIRLDTGDATGKSGSSYDPEISSDSYGHVYVTWSDELNGEENIYFNYSSDYGATWQTSDIRLNTGDISGANYSWEPQINSDSSGHVYVTWSDERNGEGDIYFNYSSDYGATWQTSDMRLDTGDTAGASWSEESKISSDDSGHIYVTWEDWQNGQPDIYFNYSNDYGATWQTSDLILGTTPFGSAGSWDTEISSDANGHVYVTWVQNRIRLDIYFNHSSDYGATWQTSDIRLDTGDFAGRSSVTPQIASDNNGHVYATWQNWPDIYFDYSNDNGATWQTNDIKLNTDTAISNGLWGPEISSDDNGHVYVPWMYNINGNTDIYFNYSSDYGVTWQTSDIRLDTDIAGASTSSAPMISNDANGHVYVTWYDDRNGEDDIYLNYSSNYGATWQTSDIRLDTGDTAGASWSGEPQISSDSSGHVYVTWGDDRNVQNGNSDIFFNYSSDYGATWQISDTRLDTGDTPGASDSWEPQISSDGSGHVYVTWSDERNGAEDVYFNHSSDYGVTWQTNDIRLGTGDTAGVSDSSVPRISNDSSGHVYVTWADERNFEDDIYFNYSRDYGATWQTRDIRLDTGDTGDSNVPRISNDSSGRVYVTWVDERNGDEDIYFNYSSNYGVTWQLKDIRLDTGSAPGASNSWAHRIGSDSSGHVYVTWTDGRNGRLDIYYNSLYISGITAPPILNIKANSSDGPITIKTSETLSVEISLTANDYAGQICDWWIIANTPSGLQSYDFAQGFVPGISVTYQGAVFDLGTSTILNTSGLTDGAYTYYFGIDLEQDGELDMTEGIYYYDSVKVTVVTNTQTLSQPTVVTASVSGTTVTISWDTVNGAEGYMLYYGFSSGNYSGTFDLGNSSSKVFYNIPTGTYYLVITAYAGTDESGYSEEASVTVR